MATVPMNLMQNLATGNNQQISTGIQNMGLPPIGNGAGSILPGPTGTGILSQPATVHGTKTPGQIPATPLGAPAGTPSSTGTSPINNVGAAPAIGTGSGVVPPASPTQTTSGAGGVQVTNTTGTGPASQVNQQASNYTLEQLENQYGKGLGAQLFSALQNLGSGDSAYMQAYEKAMAQPNAENLATLNTTLGNSGVGANSSTAAIADADFEAGVTAQEGLQEQQLQQVNEQDYLGLLSGLEGVANKNQSSSVVGDIGNVFSTIAGMF